jgi:DNA-binding XRE family transcriptional regulator
MATRAIKSAGTKFAPPVDSVPNFVETPANDDFAPVIRGVRVDNKLPRKVIAKIAGVGSETVKAWERGRQIPQSEHLFRLARTIPSVRRWTLRQLGVDQIPEFINDPKVLTAMMAAAYQVMHQNGPDGDAVRKAMKNGAARNG